jgi:hypothetical protein
MNKYNSAVTTVAILLCWVAVGVWTPAQHEGHGGQKPPAQENQRQPETRHKCSQIEMRMTTPNHPLATAYLQNIATLTRLLRDQVQQCNSVNGDFARDVVAEIWRSFDQLDCCRREQMDLTQGGMRMNAMGDHSPVTASAPSEYLALREIGAERGALTPPSPTVQGKTNLQTGNQSDDHTRLHTAGQMNGRVADQMTEKMRRMDERMTQLSARLIELERETGSANPSPKWVLEHTNAILRLLDEMSTMCGGNHTAK